MPLSGARHFHAPLGLNLKATGSAGGFFTQEQLAQSAEPSPLDRDELVALAGAGLVVVGSLLPALDSGLGTAQSLWEAANSVTIVWWGFAASVIWSVARRRTYDVATAGLLILLSLIAFGLLVWLEDVREPVATFFGSLQAEFRPMAWAVIAIGSALILHSGKCADQKWACRRRTFSSTDRLRAAGMIVATLGCLFGIALVNPFGFGGVPADIRRMSYAYKDELQVVRWALLGAAAFSNVASFQFPERSRQLLGYVIRTAGVIIGAGIFLMVSVLEPGSRLFGVPVGVAWLAFAVSIWATENSSLPVRRWKQLVLFSPYIAAVGISLALGGIEDLMFILYGPFAIAVGYVIFRNTAFVDAAIFSATLVVGLTAGLMVFGGVPNEISNLLGLNAAEARLAALSTSALLIWCVYLSFLYEGVTPAEPEAGESD